MGISKENIIFRTVVGSRAYGTNIETSDTDYKGVYLQDNNDILGFDYRPQFEVGRMSAIMKLRDS